MVSVGNMSQALVLPAAGLMVDPGPFTAAPDGGMCEAQNVVVLRPGVIEPRPGSQWFKDAVAKAGSYDARALYADPSGDVWVWSSAGSQIIRKNGSTTITGPTVFISGRIRTAGTGGRALTTSENGVCVLPDQLASPASGSATIAYRAGMPQPYTAGSYLTSAGVVWMATNSAVAYRLTLRRRLANGGIVESAPSNRIVVRNTSGGNRSPVLGSTSTSAIQGWITAQLATNDFGDLIAGDELCIYRAPLSVTPSTAEPGDEMRLRAVLAYTPASDAFVDPQTGNAWIDRAADGTWTGPALYTNSTQEGALLGNYRPEYARDIALYKGMTFFAGAQTSQRVDLRLLSCGNATAPQNSLMTRVFGATVGITLGSPTITGIAAADMAFLAVGQVIQDSAGTPFGAPIAFPAGTQIQSLTATTATMSANALVTNAVANLTAWDWVQITDASRTLRIYASVTGAAFADVNNTTFDQSVGSQDIETSWSTGGGGLGARWREFQLRVSYAADQPQTRDMVWSFFRTDCTESSFTMKSSKPYAWDRPVDSVTGIASQQSGGIAELRWSKVNEPESCPLPYRSVIGDASSAIRRIVVANQSLLIFKDDGLYQWSGDGPGLGSYQIELVDRTIVVPAPKDATAGDEPCKWVGRFDDRVYAMTTRGPMAITDTGGVMVGAPILESLRRRFVYAYGANDESLRALMIDPQSRRVGFFYDVDGTDTNGSVGYVLDVDTGTWTYWAFARPLADFGTFTSFGAPVFAGGYSYGLVAEDRTMLDDGSVTVATLPSSSDAWPSETVNASSVVVVPEGVEITIAAGSEWTPVVGDLLIQGTNVVPVTYVDSATVFGVNDPGASIIPGTVRWREGFECRCVWTARDERNVGAEKHWQSVEFAFELATLFSRYSTPTVSFGGMRSYFRGFRNPAAAIEQNVDDSSTIGVTPWPIEAAFKRVTVPTAVARDWALKVGFSIRQACGWFSTGGVSLLYGTAQPGKVTR